MYYLIEIADTKDGVAKAIYDKADLTLANMQLHQTLASAMANENVNSCLCIIINSQGTTMRHEYWQRESV